METAGTGHGAALTGTAAAAAFSLFLIPDHTGHDHDNDQCQHTEHDNIAQIGSLLSVNYTPIFTCVSAY